MEKTLTKNLPQLEVVSGYCLGYKAFRGFAPINILSEISKADIFDQENNPLGTQRNLNPKHAKNAYDYISERERAFFPEIILNIRDESYVRYVPKYEVNEQSSFGILEFIKDPSISRQIVVSRLDGNHRLWYVDGQEEGFESISRSVSFCILIIKDLNMELELFRDINDNQQGMNTSHLQNISIRLSEEMKLKEFNPSLYIANKLQTTQDSPFYQKIHQGGVARRGSTLTGLTTANLSGAIKDMLGRSSKLSKFEDAEVQFELICNYWKAVKMWLPEAWNNPSDYIIFKGAGLIAISYVGVDIIDRCLIKGEFTPDKMLEYLNKIGKKEILLHRRGTLKYVGRTGAKSLANELLNEVEEEGEISIVKLQKMILGKK